MDTQGDSFFVAFRRAKDAVAASVAAQRALAAHDWPQGVEVKVRIGLHTGEPSVGGERYVGVGVHKAARVCAAAHGGEVVVSESTRALVEDDLPEGVSLRDLGEHALKDLDRPERLFQLVIAGLPTEFPPPRTLTPAPPPVAALEEPALEFGILGPLEVSANGRVLPLGGQKQRAVLALLLLDAGRVVSLDRLIDGVWGERPPRTAAASLQNFVAQLRKLLGPDILVTRSPGYVLRVEPEQLDLSRFRRLVDEARQADPDQRAGLLGEALELWRGPPLAEFRFDAFAQNEIGRLEEMRLGALEERIEADLDAGRHADLVGELESLVDEHPLRERLREQLILALYRSGRQVEALDADREARRRLVDELGLEPSRRLQDLHGAILRHEPGLFDEAPPLTTFDKRPADLPIPPTPLIGRERELNEIVGFVRTHRLVTLTGPGGSGKTRLALAAAAELVDEFPEGVWFVSLATLADPQLIEPTIAGVVGAQDGLADVLRGKKLLLLLDNLEQLLPDVAPIVSALGAHVLATSRERLNVAGEQEFPVPALPLEDAVALFAQRARQLKPAFEPDTHVPEIARRLDGLPLAIELAAARVKALTPQQILERLGYSLALLTAGARDAPARQRTLRATIEWSYELLTPPEQRLFERLAVFAGSFDLEAAEGVCDGDLDTVETLVDKSLLRQTDEGRFFMLETIREYAAERLDDSGEAEELRRRHAEHFLALAEEAEPNLPLHPSEWLERLEREHNNLRAALDRLEESGEGELASRLAGALSRFWNMSGHLAEGRRRLDSALRSNERPTAARAKALNGATLLALAIEDLATARLWAEEGLALHRQLGDAWGTAHAEFLLGNVVSGEGDPARAQQLFEESVRQFRELGDEHYTLLAILNLAVPCEQLGDRERARALYEHVVRRARATSDERIEAASLERLAGFVLDEGRVQEAVSMLKDSLRIYRDLGGPLMTADSLTFLAHALAVEGSAETAARILSSSNSLYEEIGAVRSWAASMTEETLTTIRAQLEEAAFAEAWEQGRALTVDEAIALAFDSED